MIITLQLLLTFIIFLYQILTFTTKFDFLQQIHYLLTQLMHYDLPYLCRKVIISLIILFLLSLVSLLFSYFQVKKRFINNPCIFNLNLDLTIKNILLVHLLFLSFYDHSLLLDEHNKLLLIFYVLLLPIYVYYSNQSMQEFHF
jgi:hypothetical protein